MIFKLFSFFFSFDSHTLVSGALPEMPEVEDGSQIRVALSLAGAGEKKGPYFKI